MSNVSPPDKAPRATLWSRRDLLTRSGWAMLLAGGGACLVAGVRLLFPRVRSSPPTDVVLGRPEAYAVGEISERFKSSHRVVLVREERGFYALSAVCTHLGCAPDWVPSRSVFRCPCHGSDFDRVGRNLVGPAPRPLERLKITLDDEGRIVVDTAVRFRAERGEWDRPGAYLRWERRG
jgi:cytochrome b6-f complex iron-sulfur subunit